MDRRLGTLAAALAVAALACGSRARSGGGHDAAVAAPSLPPGAQAASPSRDSSVADEPDAALLAAADVLEGSAAEAAMAEAMARDASPSAAPAAPGEEPPATGIENDGVAGFRLGQSRAEVARRLGPTVALVRQPRAGPDAPLAEEAVLRGATGLPWLRLRIYAGRLVELEVLARDGRALTDEGIGVGSSFEEAALAHGEARAVADEKTGRVRGWVLADLPGLLWVAAGPAIAGDAETAPPETARVGRIRVLGAEQLTPPD